ncbi:MAG: PorT family protein [Mucilaginibacter polytrichastri]|nr:PorT family protein [Mucilaginibacter polytrichastri]
MAFLKRAAGIFLVFCLVQQLQAQSNWKPAEITFQNGSTVAGLIEYHNWDVAPASVLFRTDKTTSSNRIKADSIQFVTVKDQNISALFEYHSIKVEITKSSTGSYFDERTPEYAERGLLLRCLVKGKYSLYVTYLNNRNVYYLSNRDNIPYELINRSYLLKTYNKRYDVHQSHIQLDSRFQGQFNVLGCADAVAVNRATYTRKSLISLVKKCNGDAETFIASTFTLKNRFGLVAGPTFAGSAYHESSEFGHRLDKDAFVSGSAGLYIGVFGDFMMSKQVQKFSVYIEASYSQVKSSGTVALIDTKDYVYRANLNYGKISVMPRYYFASKRAFLNVGPAVSIALSGTQTKTDTAEITKPIYENLRKLTIGGVGGAGVSFKNFSLEGRYEVNTGFSPFPRYGNTLHIVSVLAGFSF